MLIPVFWCLPYGKQPSDKGNSKMNKESRDLVSRALVMMQEAQRLLNIACESQQEAFDNMSDACQESPKGEAIIDSISAIEEGINSLESAIAETSDALPIIKTK
jgi:hypothetical protein